MTTAYVDSSALVAMAMNEEHSAMILPDRPLTEEIEAALSAGYLRGADLLHAATALYAARGEQGMAFLTLDRQLHEVARGLGFEA